MQPGGGPASYAARLLLDGREALRTGPLRQAQYTGWGRLLGAAPGGRPAPAPPLVRPDAASMVESAGVPRYDLSTGVDEALLARFGAEAAAPAWGVPLGARGLTQYMPMTGGRADIGPATQAQAAWLITGDRRAAAYVIGQAEAAGAVPWHFWDPRGGASGTGGWMDSRHRPKLWVDYRGGTNGTDGLLQPVGEDSGWTSDTAHQPDLSYVPYLVTGRRAFLDNLQAQASHAVMTHWPSAYARGEAGATGPGEGVNVIRSNQVRGAAWSLRQLDEAGWISPEDDPSRAFFEAAAAGNWTWLRAQLPALTASQGEAHGWVGDATGEGGTLAPWQQDYFASTAAAAARRGSEDAKVVLAWMGNFLAGRFLAGAKGFNPRDGVAYTIAIAPEGGKPGPFRSWAECGAATRARGLSNQDGWSKSGGNYGQLGLQALAALRDVVGSEEARRAYDWLAEAGAPYTQLRDYFSDPLYNIVPRGVHRAPSQAQRCVAVAAAAA
jgi:hypothetical protein